MPPDKKEQSQSEHYFPQIIYRDNNAERLVSVPDVYPQSGDDANLPEIYKKPELRPASFVSCFDFDVKRPDSP